MAPIWNFSKYLVSDQGELIGYFEPSVSPTGKEIRLPDAVNESNISGYKRLYICIHTGIFYCLYSMKNYFLP